MLNDLEVVIMARLLGDSGQAAVLDPNQIKRLLKIAQTTSHGQRDQTIITLSYWLGLRAKELASLKVGDVYLADGSVKQILHLKAGYTKRGRIRDVYLSSDKIQKGNVPKNVEIVVAALPALSV
jgi:integrase/recombinase XerD